MTPNRRIPLLLLPLLAGLALPSAAAADTGPVARASYVSGEVVVRYKRSADRAARAAVQRETGVGRPRAFAPRTRVLKIRDGQSTAETLRELRARPEVATAAPNPVARVTGFIPADPGRAPLPGGGQQRQW
jgi:serine protease